MEDRRPEAETGVWEASGPAVPEKIAGANASRIGPKGYYLFFMCGLDEIKAVCDRMVEKGATVVDPLGSRPWKAQMAVLRDPYDTDWALFASEGGKECSDDADKAVADQKKSSSEDESPGNKRRRKESN